MVPTVLHLARSRDGDWKDRRPEFLRTDIWLGVSALRKRQDPPQVWSGFPARLAFPGCPSVGAGTEPLQGSDIRSVSTWPCYLVDITV